MSLAMAVAGVLVALLVGAWLQATRAGTRSAQEASEDRAERDCTRNLQALVDGAQWSSTSHLPQGALGWEGGSRTCALWSRSAAGLPGMGHWSLWVEGRTLKAAIEDAQGEGKVQRQWEGVSDLRLEVAQRVVANGGEALEWLPMERWDPALPFRPIALRLTWLKTDGSVHAVTAWP